MGTFDTPEITYVRTAQQKKRLCILPTFSSIYHLLTCSSASSRHVSTRLSRTSVAVTRSSCVSPTLVMHQSYAIRSLVTRQMCPPRPITLEIERLESSENVDQNVMVRRPFR